MLRTLLLPIVRRWDRITLTVTAAGAILLGGLVLFIPALLRWIAGLALVLSGVALLAALGEEEPGHD